MKQASEQGEYCVANDRDREETAAVPVDWQDWQRWVEDVDWSDWRSWLQRLAATD